MANPELSQPPRPSLMRRYFRRVSGENAWFVLLLIPAVVILLGVIVIPMLWTLKMSLANTSVSVVGGRGSVGGQFVGWRNYIFLLTDPQFWVALRETLYFWIVSIGIEVTLGIGMALLLNRPFRGFWLVRAVIFIPWAIPTVVNATLWGMIFNGNNYGALNDLLLRWHWIAAPVVWLNPSPLFARIPWLSHALSAIGSNLAINAIIVGDEWKTLPLVAFLVLAGLQMIPQDFYEAARIEGASAWTQFNKITLPLIGPVLSVVLILRTMQLLRAFTILFTLEGYGLPVLSIGAYQQAFSFGNFGIGSAEAFIIGVMALVIAYFYVRKLYREEMQ
ncbi:MAG: sugar ABC transporter permease [Thermaerobacter sp.]|nr:sugar ABC transporter permease [Thermaerobacter sp.]